MKVRQDIEKITMYSTSWCADCARAKLFYEEYGIDFEEIDIESNPDAAAIVEKINGGNRSVPTIVNKFSDGESILVEPNRTELEQTYLDPNS